MPAPSGQLHEADEIAQMLRSLGFIVEAPRMLEAPPYSVGAMIAKKG